VENLKRLDLQNGNTLHTPRQVATSDRIAMGRHYYHRNMELLGRSMVPTERIGAWNRSRHLTAVSTGEAPQ
jgi:hypothetical protein